ncbi:hypothetical protein OGAPHI_004467 [Ogataea philodendri]|uniref:Prenylcysteine lyase domain-containing protein n=1 Tax=Ogataea philodendri TaxID=1378263 RepID=A0A9P8P5N8_9ASCO|nr:uncharacterized protein OGAPHI_004467 [Ogataea philodendri]KAH3666278.1 hypothetical protein OGAPHI_004467 [Ogataea philodendri]
MLAAVVLLFVSCLAYQQPIPVSNQRVAIVGAGAGGSSAAYHLQKFTGHAFNITVFDKNDYIGGRSTPIDFDGVAAELGASIFIQENELLANAAEVFNLTVTEGFGNESSFAIWDGQAMDYILEPSSSDILTSLRLVWRFGLYSISIVKYYQSQALDSFISDYYQTYFPWPSLNYITGLVKYTSQSSQKFFDSLGISDNYKSFIQGLTRNNYSQKLPQIHSLGSLVLLTGSSSLRISGGNNQIFQNWLKSSNADVKLNTSVTALAKDSTGYTVTYGSKSEHFDIVILAGPYNQLGITTNVSVSLSDVEYVHLYVTLVRSPHLLSESTYFDDPNTPQMVFTTDGDDFTYVGAIGYSSEYQEYVYKVFSFQNLDEDLLQRLFGNYSNKYVKDWYSYPNLTPRDKFDDFKLDNNLYYLNAIEPFLSTMETSSLAGANVAGLIAQGKNTTEISIP